MVFISASINLYLYLKCMHAKSPVVLTLVTLECSCQTSLSMDSPYAGVEEAAMPSRGSSNSGLEPMSLISPALAVRQLPLVPPGKPHIYA